VTTLSRPNLAKILAAEIQPLLSAYDAAYSATKRKLILQRPLPPLHVRLDIRVQGDQVHYRGALTWGGVVVAERSLTGRLSDPRFDPVAWVLERVRDMERFATWYRAERVETKPVGYEQPIVRYKRILAEARQVLAQFRLTK
jgi:hypothetical protein